MNLKKTPISLALAILIYLAIRALALITNFDDLCLQGYEMWPMGNLAKDVIEGGGYPALRYCDTHSGGEYVTGFCAVPFFYLLGDSYFALKMVPLLFGLVTLVLLYFFLRSNFSSQAAGMGALLFALSPTTLTKHSMIAMGNHFEILLFVTVLLFCFYRHMTTNKKLWLGLTGLAAGLALFHNFSSLIVIGLLILTHLFARGFKGTVINLVGVSPFFLLGALPLIVINLMKGGVGFDFLQAKFLSESQVSLSRISERFFSFFYDHLPKAGCYEDLFAFSGKIGDAVWLLCFIGAYLFCVRKNPKVLPFLLYLPILGLGYAFGNFKIGGYQHPVEVGGYRYFLTHILFSIILISIAFSWLWQKPGYKRFFAMMLASGSLLIGLFNLGVADLTFSKTVNMGRRYDGFCHLKYARGIYRDEYAGDPRLLQQGLRDFNPIHRSHVYYGVGALKALKSIRPLRTSQYQERQKFRLNNFNVQELLNDIPDAHKIDGARGIGAYLRVVIRVNTALDQLGDVGTIVNKLMENPNVYNTYVMEGLSLNREYLLERETVAFFIETEKIAKQLKKFSHYIRRGEGILAGRLLLRGIGSEKMLIDALAKRLKGKEQAVFYFGMGWGFADGGDTPQLPGSYLKNLSKENRDRVYLGYVSAIYHIFGPKECFKILESHGDLLPCSHLEAVEKKEFWKKYPAAVGNL